MESDRWKWNDKFDERSTELLPPEGYLVENVDALEPGKVLDVACGDGRNALYLAEEGFEVCGVDISEVGLARLETFARKRHLDVETRRRDLDNADLSDLGPFANVTVFHFKPPPSFWEQAPDLLRSGGVLMLATFSTQQHREHDFPERFCLREDELVDISAELECIRHSRYSEPGKFLAGYIFRKL